MSQVGAQLVVKYGATGGSPSTTVNDVTDVAIPEQASAAIQNTTYATTGKTHDMIPGYRDPGKIVITANYTIAQDVAMRAIQDVRKAWSVTVGGENAGSYTCEGYIESVSPTLPVDGKLTQKYTVQVCTALVAAATS